MHFICITEILLRNSNQKFNEPTPCVKFGIWGINRYMVRGMTDSTFLGHDWVPGYDPDSKYIIL